MRGEGEGITFGSAPFHQEFLFFVGLLEIIKSLFLTIDQLRKRNHIIVNGCPLCLNDEETVHHLLIHCPFAHGVWSAIINMYDMNWVMPRTVEDLFIQCGLDASSFMEGFYG